MFLKIFSMDNNVCKNCKRNTVKNYEHKTGVYLEILKQKARNNFNSF